MVMAEAMACGTPVIAFARGAAPEIVVDGETGYLVDDVDSMVAAVGKVERIDPGRCRQHVLQHFSPSIMAERYIAIYSAMLDRTARERPLALTPASAFPTSAAANGEGQVAMTRGAS